MLSDEIEDAMSGLRGESDRVRWRLFLQRAGYAVADYAASHRSLLPVVVALIFVDLAALVAGIRAAPTWICADSLRGFVFALWQVTAAILGVTLVVVVFLVQSILTEEQREEGLFRLYVRKSYILPITFLGIGLVANMGLVSGFLSLGTMTRLGPLSMLATINLLIFISTLLLIAWLYWRTVQFLSPRFLRAAIREVVREGVVVGVRGEIARRLGLNLLRQRCEELGIAYLHESSPIGKVVVPVTMPVRQKALYVEDLDLDRLKRFAAEVMRRRLERQTDEPVAWLVKGYRSVVSAFFDEIGYLPVEDYSDELAALLVGCLKTREYREKNGLQDRLNYLKGQALRAMRSGQDAQLEELLETYVSAVEAWLATMQGHGITYDPEMVQGSLYFEWESLHHIRRHFSDLLRSATGWGSIELLRHVLYLPVKLMRVAVTYGDHLVFQRFVGAFPEMYASAVRLREDHACREYIMDRAGTFPVEFSQLHLEAQLVPPRGSPEEVVKTSDYAIELMVAFNSLLKSAVGFQDVEAYHRFGDALDRLFERVFRERGFDTELKLMELELGERQNDASRSESAGDATGPLEAVHRALYQVQVTRSEIWFGLAAWVLRQYRSGKMGQDAFHELYPRAAGHFRSLGELARIYEAVRGEDSRGGRFSWDWWEMDDSHAETVAMRFSWSTTDDWLMWFYVARGLELTPQTIGGSGMPVKPDLATPERLELLGQMCDKIVSDERLRTGILSAEGWEQRIARFLTLHSRAAEVRARQDEESLIAEEISPQACEQFRTQFVEAWRKEAVLRAVIARYGHCVDRTNALPPAQSWRTGLEHLLPKEVFLSPPLSWLSYLDAATGAVAEAEHGALVKAFDEYLAARTHASNSSDLPLAIRSAVAELQTGGRSPNAILVGGWNPGWMLEGSDGFVPSWREVSSRVDLHGYVGSYDGISVFLLLGTARECCLVLDLQRLGTLTQYQAAAVPGESLSVEVQAVDDEAARALVAKDPGWRRDKGTGRFITTDAALRRLRQLARVQVCEKWTFDISDAGAGVFITVEPEHELDTLM